LKQKQTKEIPFCNNAWAYTCNSSRKEDLVVSLIKPDPHFGETVKHQGFLPTNKTKHQLALLT